MKWQLFVICIQSMATGKHTACNMRVKKCGFYWKAFTDVKWALHWAIVSLCLMLMGGLHACICYCLGSSDEKEHLMCV